MFTGIIEELGEVTAWAAERRRGAHHRARAARRSDAKHGDSISVERRLPHRRRPGRRLVHRGCHGRVDRDVSTLGTLTAGRPRQPRARGSARATASAATSCRATSTAPRRSSRSTTARPGGCCASRSTAELRAARHPQGLDRGRRRLAHRERGQRPGRGEQWFEVSLIPETLAATTLGALEAGDRSTSRPTSSPATSSGCSRVERTAEHAPQHATQRSTEGAHA